MQSNRKRRVLVSSFMCSANAKSESYAGYKWLEQIARYCDATLITTEESAISGSWKYIRPSARFAFKNRLLRRLNGEVMIDYFWFDYRSKLKVKSAIANYDLVHHLVPIAPRYPCSIGTIAKNFILGPIGGGLRVPATFRHEVEGREEWFYKLRLLDRIRLNYDPLLRKTYRAATRILIVGEYMFDIIPKEYHSKCRIMLDVGIDSKNYKPSWRSDTLNRENVKLLYVGRVVPYKGLIYALRCLDQLPVHVKDKVHLTVVGDRGEGHYERHCRDFVVERNLHNIVTFVGKKDKQEVLEYYEKCDLFVFPSLAEAGGNAVLEAMAMGKPVLAVRRGGPAESVSQDAGFLLDPRDPEYMLREMRDILISVVTQRHQLIDKGINARRRIENLYDWSVKGDMLAKVYSEVLDSAFHETKFSGD